MVPDTVSLAPSDRVCPVVFREDLAAGCWRLVVEWPEVARAARPAQFAMLRPARGMEPLLRRPFSIADADPSAGTVSFLGKRIGPGTEALGRVDAGDTLEIIAPLGNGFRWKPGAGSLHLLLAGGVGIAPFPLLARRLREAGEEVVLLYGGRRMEDLVLREAFEEMGVRVRCIVEEGPGPATGLVTDLLEEVLAEDPGPSRLRAYSCGPTPMLAAVGDRLAGRGVPHQTSLEEYMACGFGVCIGCAVPVHGPEDEVIYEQCCIEGPVFDFTRLAW